mgnify:CR=1 FL=1
MVDQYYDDEEYFDDYEYDDEGYTPPPKPKPKAKPAKPPQTPKTFTPNKNAKNDQNSPKSTPKKESNLTKKMAKLNVNSEIESRLKTEKPVVYMVVIGHVDSGKSTLVGQLAVSGGNLTRGEQKKLQQAADEQGKRRRFYKRIQTSVQNLTP